MINMEEQTPTPLTKHERKELKKKLKQEQVLAKEERRDIKKKKKKFITLLIIFLLVAGLGYVIFALSTGGKTQSYSKGEVHWHAKLKVFICGTQVEMPAPPGEHELGLPLLHTHQDRLIHIEGTVWKPEDIMLGKYMQAIGKNFKEDSLLDKKNGDLCNTTQGKVKLFANGKEDPALTQYVIKDGDEYELHFE